MRRQLTILLVLGPLVAIGVGAPPTNPVPRTRFVDPTSLPRYESRYYVIYSDLDPDSIQEATIRLTKMAEVYHERTRGFSGTINRKFPFVLFKSADDYRAAGGPDCSAGIYDGRLLMAIAGEKLTARTWHTVQHEGFHQFAMNVIRGDLPVWVNEGLAEYFGEGLFTGDDMMTGIIPEWRRRRIVKTMQAGGFKSIDQIMRTRLDQWNRELDVANYDQAWSMVQFLAHGDDGKYQQAFSSFMNLLSKGRGQTEAWQAAFGDSQGFEQRWREYWLAQPEDPTDTLYRKATLACLTSFLARACAANQVFNSVNDFGAAAENGTLKCHRDDVLPRSLLALALEDAGKRMKSGEKITLVYSAETRLPELVLTAPGVAPLVGRFTVRNGLVDQVTVDER